MSKQPQPQPPLRTPIEFACLPDDTIASAAAVAHFLSCSVARLQRWEREGHGLVCLRSASRTAGEEYRMGDVRRWMALPVVRLGTSAALGRDGHYFLPPARHGAGKLITSL